jgi:hypothetical protein
VQGARSPTGLAQLRACAIGDFTGGLEAAVDPGSDLLQLGQRLSDRAEQWSALEAGFERLLHPDESEEHLGDAGQLSWLERGALGCAFDRRDEIGNSAERQGEVFVLHQRPRLVDPGQAPAHRVGTVEKTERTGPLLPRLGATARGQGSGNFREAEIGQCAFSELHLPAVES